METSAEMTQREKVMKYVKQYVLITLSISIMSVGVYFFKFPNNFVFGGVTGTAALVAKLTPMSASAFSSAANLVLLVVGLIFLGKEFAMTTGYATFVMSVELMAFEKLCPLSGPLSDQPMLDLLFAIALPAIASALLFNVGASSGGTDIIALIVEKYTHIHSGRAVHHRPVHGHRSLLRLRPVHGTLFLRGPDGQVAGHRRRAGKDQDVQGHPHRL